MIDAATEAWLDQEDRHVAMTIRRAGCSIQYESACGCDEECRNGRFPWDPGYAVPEDVHPRPGTSTA